MHCEKVDLPPVGAFWPLTMYGADGFRAANSLNQLAIGGRDTLEHSAYGSLGLYIQREGAGGDKQGTGCRPMRAACSARGCDSMR
jgi:hypothetical protein